MKPAPVLGLVPHLFVEDVTSAISFYHQAFGAIEPFGNVLPDGTVLFVELAVGDARLLISEEIAKLDALSPKTLRCPRKSDTALSPKDIHWAGPEDIGLGCPKRHWAARRCR